jgi:hypothetical protein
MLCGYADGDQAVGGEDRSAPMLSEMVKPTTRGPHCLLPRLARCGLTVVTAIGSQLRINLTSHGRAGSSQNDYLTGPWPKGDFYLGHRQGLS